MWVKYPKNTKNNIGTSDFRAKIKNERFTFERSRCRQNLKSGDFHVVVVQRTARLCVKMRAARAARLFFLF